MLVLSCPMPSPCFRASPRALLSGPVSLPSSRHVTPHSRALSCVSPMPACVCCRLTSLDAPCWWRDARRARGQPCLPSSVRSVSQSACHALSTDVMYREALYWRLDCLLGASRASDLRPAIPAWVAPADCARYAQRGGGRMRGLVILRNACLPACLLTCLT